MGQFERVKLMIDEPSFTKLQNSWVAVFGVGGVGASCVESLVRTGITNLVLIDYDVVEFSNINRQIQANHDTVGMVKTTALKEKLLAINPEVNVIEINEFMTKENFNLIEQYPIDMVVDAIDAITSKIDLIEYCVKRKIPIISSCGMGNRIDPTKITISKLSKTFNDPLAKVLRLECKKRRCDKIPVVFSTELPIKRPRPIASLSFVVNVAGHVLASYVIKKVCE